MLEHAFEGKTKMQRKFGKTRKFAVSLQVIMCAFLHTAKLVLANPIL